ncbi:FAD binding domain-containing protein [Herbaspirillum autotrophicum]|uniref:FAD binding domain-containing protein n=1 Tax=Herbaspirillum autotrophicum TaxID=180195 RepID=UPI00067E2DB9|nr:FAD binding domain-containing protein [Herbaspirillum autotrophicum]
MLMLQRPAAVAAAVSARAAAGSAYVAGGTALQLAWNQGQALPQQLIDLSQLPQWRHISVGHHALQIAAGVTLEQCRTDLRVQQHAPLLTQVCAVIGALSVRNVGTLGGNLAWRSGDSIAALMVLDARLQLHDESPVSVSDFLQLQHDDALLLGIVIGRRSRHTFFEKAGYREAFTPTLVLVCGAFECDANGRLKNVRLAFSGAGLRARRLPSLEAWLEGRDPQTADWHAGFDTCLRSLLADCAGLSLLQRQVVQALLPGKLYACCRELR